MNAMNSLIRSGLNQALGALHALADQGETVIGVRVESRNPVLTIEPPHSEFVRAAGVSRKRRGHRSTTFAARLHGVQVEWETQGLQVVRAAAPAVQP